MATNVIGLSGLAWFRDAIASSSHAGIWPFAAEADGAASKAKARAASPQTSRDTGARMTESSWPVNIVLLHGGRKLVDGCERGDVLTRVGHDRRRPRFPYGSSG